MRDFLSEWFFKREDHADIGEARSFEALLPIALRVLERMPPRVLMVCGPISTGGLGSIEKNLERFHVAIRILIMRGENIFSQMPFEHPIQQIRKIPGYEQGHEHLLNSFYLPIFKSGRITRMCFLPDWHSSKGARWEFRQANLLGIDRVFFRSGFEHALDSDPIFQS